MTTSWNDETAGAGQDITIYDINKLRDFVQDVVDNFSAIDTDKNLEQITLLDSPHN